MILQGLDAAREYATAANLRKAYDIAEHCIKGAQCVFEDSHFDAALAEMRAVLQEDQP